MWVGVPVAILNFLYDALEFLRGYGWWGMLGLLGTA